MDTVGLILRVLFFVSKFKRQRYRLTVICAQGYAQLVMEIFADCFDDLEGSGGEANDVPVVEFAIYLFILSIFR